MVWYSYSPICAKKLMFWRKKFKPHQFHYIAIEVKIGPPMAGPGWKLWAPFLVWYLRVPIGTTKRVSSPIWGFFIFKITLLCIPRSPFRRLWQFCVQKVQKIKLTISVEAPVAETHPTMISEPMRLPRNVKAKLTHPVVTTWIWKDKNGRNVRKAS